MTQFLFVTQSIEMVLPCISQKVAQCSGAAAIDYAAHFDAANLMRQYVHTQCFVFLQFVVDNRKAQKNLLICFEKLVETYIEQLLPKAAHILKMFYDTDILEEEAILEWADKVCMFAWHTV